MAGCEDLSPYALQVQGDSMEPEFPHGAIIIIDPGYPPASGLYVVCEYQGDVALRQLIDEHGQRFLRPVNPTYPTVEVTGPLDIKGVATQKTTREGGKRQVTHYV